MNPWCFSYKKYFQIVFFIHSINGTFYNFSWCMISTHGINCHFH